METKEPELKDIIKDTDNLKNNNQINQKKDKKEEISTNTKNDKDNKLNGGKKEEINSNIIPNKENNIKEENKEESIEKSNPNPIRKNKYELKNLLIYIIIPFLILLLAIIYKKKKKVEKAPTKNEPPKFKLIDNNNEKNVGVLQLINEEPNNKITIKKGLIKTVKNFIACIGPSGAGKSAFASNYYKYLFHVKNDYFEVSKSKLSFTKGIWMISEEERGKIQEYINNDILDVEGFECDKSESFKFVHIIAFLSTDLILLNRNPRYDEIKKILKIIVNHLIRMMKFNLPRFIKNIYIQIVEEPDETIDELLESFEIDKKVFDTINFEYMYLPYIQGKNKDIMNNTEYRDEFEKIMKKLNRTKDYNSVSSLIEYIDDFNKAINEETEFESQKMFIDIKNEFEGKYSKRYEEFKSELMLKLPYLKKPNLNETFEEFINKQKNVTFKFDIKNSNFSLYGSSPIYNDCYEKLKKEKSFEIDPKEVFLDFYNTEKLILKTKESEKKVILNLFLQKKREIDSYFDRLEFYQVIEKMDLEIKIETDLDFKNKREKELKEYFIKKEKEKKKEWEDQIQRAKWKMPVQAIGSTECKNGHKFKSDDVVCKRCHKNLYWVDGDTNYVICKGCGIVRKIKDKFECRCGAELPDKLKRIPGYKP